MKPAPDLQEGKSMIEAFVSKLTDGEAAILSHVSIHCHGAVADETYNLE